MTGRLGQVLSLGNPNMDLARRMAGAGPVIAAERPNQLASPGLTPSYFPGAKYLQKFTVLSEIAITSDVRYSRIARPLQRSCIR